VTADHHLTVLADAVEALGMGLANLHAYERRLRRLAELAPALAEEGTVPPAACALIADELPAVTDALERLRARRAALLRLAELIG